MLDTAIKSDRIAERTKGPRGDLFVDPLTLIVTAHVVAVVSLVVGLLIRGPQLYMVSGTLLAAALMLFVSTSERPRMRVSAKAFTPADAPDAPFPQLASKPVTAEALLQQDLSEALGHGELRLVYQPLARLSSGKTIGYEALIRWDHPQHGLLMRRQYLIHRLAVTLAGLLDPGGLLLR